MHVRTRGLVCACCGVNSLTNKAAFLSGYSLCFAVRENHATSRLSGARHFRQHVKERGQFCSGHKSARRDQQKDGRGGKGIIL